MKKIVLIAMVSLLSVAAHAKVTAIEELPSNDKLGHMRSEKLGHMRSEKLGHMRSAAAVERVWFINYRQEKLRYTDKVLFDAKLMEIKGLRDFKASDLKVSDSIGN